MQVDPAFGDKDLFAKVVNEAHARGMKVMLDAVFNHLGDQSMQWQDVVKNGPSSRFASWFHINEYPVEPYRDPLKGEGSPKFDTFAFEKLTKLITTSGRNSTRLLLISSQTFIL